MNLHHKATAFDFYKKWHDFRFSKHVHMGILAIYAISILFTAFALPNQTFAALTEQDITITSQAEFEDGTLTDAVANGDQVQLQSSELSSSGGGDWDYIKKVTIDNSAGGELTDYQVEIDSTEGAIVDYDFEETSGSVLDDSHHNISASIYNGANQNTVGAYGNGIYFDGSNDYAETADNPTLNPTDEITVEAWFNPKPGSFATQKFLVQKAYTSHSGTYYQYGLVAGDAVSNPNRVNFYLTVGGTLRSIIVNNSGWKYSQWNHLVGTYNGSTIRLYLNGQEVGTPVSTTGSIAAYDTPLTLGAYTNLSKTSTYCYGGSLDGVRVLGNALEDTEVADRYVHYYSEMSDKEAFFNALQSDGDDMRFLGSDGSTELYHWKEELSNDSSERKNFRYYVKDSISAGATKDIYIYYGNDSATTTSYLDGSSVFEFFDDFNDGDYNGWTKDLGTSSTWSVSGGELVQSNITEYSFLVNTNYSAQDYIYDVDVKRDSITTYMNVLGRYSDINNRDMNSLRVTQLDNRLGITFGGSTDYYYTDISSSHITTGVWHKYTLEYSGSTVSSYFDNIKYSTTSSATAHSGGVGVASYNGTISFDNPRVRQNVANAPDVSCEGGIARMLYSKDITFDTTAGGAGVATDQYSFPVAIHINSLSWPNQSERDAFFDNAGADGKGVQFWEADESYALDYEVEFFDNNQGSEEALYWVRVPKVDGDSSTDKIVVAYGRDTGQDESRSERVWANGYSAVYHLNEDKAEGAFDDSTFYNNTLTNSNTVSESGKLGKARFLDSTNDYLYKTSMSPGSNDQGGAYEVWINPADKSYGYVVDSATGSTGDRSSLLWALQDPNRMGGLLADGSWAYTWNTFYFDTSDWDVNEWHHAGFSWDGTITSGDNMFLYKSGAMANSVDGNESYFPDGVTNLSVGDYFSHSAISDYNFNGKIDELRYSVVARSDDYMKLSYYSTNTVSSYSGDSLITFGSQGAGSYTASGYAVSGTYESPSTVATNVMDMSWIGDGSWVTVVDNFQANVTIPGAEESIQFEARTGHDHDGDGTITWAGSWANLGMATATGTFTGSNAAWDALDDDTSGYSWNYLQIKATLASSDGSDTPVLSDYTITYGTDVTAPTNPSDPATFYTDSGMGTGISDDSWTNEGDPYITWAGAADGAGESGLGCYYVYFGTDNTADPETAGLEIGGEKCHSSASIDFSAVDVNPLDSATSGETYYLRIDTKDKAGNVADMANGTDLFAYKFDDVAPTNPATIERTPLGWTSSNSFNFDWPDAGAGGGATDDNSTVCGYEYRRDNGTDPWSYTTNSEVSGVQAYQEGTNEFQVRSKDCAGNVVASTLDINYYYSSAAPSEPINLQVSPGVSTVNEFNFTWEEPTTINGDSIEEYCYSVNATPSAINTTCTTLLTTGIIPAATQQGLNTFYVVAKNNLNNIDYGAYASVQFEASTTAPSAPGDASVTDSSNRASSQWSLTASWNASTGNVDHYNVYRSENDVDYTKIATTTTNGYYDSGLTQAQTYYYKVTAEDNAGAEGAFSTTVTDQPTGKYTAPPTIVSGPHVEATAVGAVVTWSTDRASSSFVEYSTDVSYGLSNGSLTPVTDHAVTLSGLNPSTAYNFRVQSMDEERDYDSSEAYSGNFTFVTSSAPGISEVEVSDVGLDSAIVTWKTTSSATSTIKYGTSTSYGTEITDESGSSVTKHTIKIDDLTHSTIYNFKITGTDIDNNYMESDNYVFTTLTYPRVSNVRFEQQANMATSTLKVTWESNVPLTSIVEYRLADGGTAKEISSSKLKTKHETVVSGLKDNTDYLMVIKGRDAYGNLASSDTNRVKTDFDTRPPEVFNVTTETEVTGFGIDAKGQLVVSWETDEPATSQIEYAIGSAGDEYPSRTQEDTSLTTSHVVIISDLKTSSPYHFRIISRDKSDNVGYSEDHATLTGQATESILDVLIKSLENTIGWLFG